MVHGHGSHGHFSTGLRLFQQFAHTPKELSKDQGDEEPGGQYVSPRLDSRTSMRIAADEHAKQLRTHAVSSLREMLWYAAFLVLFSVGTLLGRNNQNVYWFANSISGQLAGTEFPPQASTVKKTLGDVATINDLHTYIQGVLYPIVYTSASFNSTYLNGTVMGVYLLVGAPRIGTLRVRSQACRDAHRFVLPAGTQCQPDYSKQTADTTAYGVGGVYTHNEFANEPHFVSTATSLRYPPPTYNVVLPREEAPACNLSTAYSVSATGSELPAECTAANALFALEANDFVDVHTRAVFIDVNMYHPTLAYMAVVRVTFEMLASGGAIPYLDVDAFRPYPYEYASDYAILGVEMATLAMVLAYLYFELLSLLQQRSKYLSDLSNVPHLANLLLFIVVWIFRLLAWSATPKAMEVATGEYLPLRQANDHWKTAQAVNSFNMFLSYVKVFKYLAFMPQFAQLTRTLRHSASKVGGFFAILGIVIVGGAQAFYLAFGSKMSDYRNIKESIYSLIRAVLGDFSLIELRAANLWLGPLFFGTFIILAVFVLLNMFIAIVSDAYTETRLELEREFSKGKVAHGTIIMHVLLFDFVYKIPYFGPKLRSAVHWAETTTRRMSLAPLASVGAQLAHLLPSRKASVTGPAGGQGGPGSGTASPPELVALKVDAGGSPEKIAAARLGVTFAEGVVPSSSSGTDHMASLMRHSRAKSRNAVAPAPPDGSSSSDSGLPGQDSGAPARTTPPPGRLTPERHFTPPFLEDDSAGPAPQWASGAQAPAAGVSGQPGSSWEGRQSGPGRQESGMAGSGRLASPVPELDEVPPDQQLRAGSSKKKKQKKHEEGPEDS